jgi:REP element-mobilizing transposase RayT
MAREGREKSGTGIYHIMLRGIDKRNIFFDDEDRTKFIENMIRAQDSDTGRFEIYGYCLMDNHIHLLLKEIEDIGTVIKRVTVGYVGWSNRKYERTGHLFQNRYMSETVETESYLLTVLRYIHQNPVKAGMVKSVKDYDWSSYKQYYHYYKGQDTIVNGDLIKAYFTTFQSFSEFMTTKNDDKCLEYSRIERYNDKSLRELIYKEYDAEKLYSASEEEKHALIRDIYYDTNTSMRQLGRVTGIGKSVIEKAVRQDK